MAVLKQISPTHVPVAPKDSPSKHRPSSRAKSARISPGSMRSYRAIFKCFERNKFFSRKRIPQVRRAPTQRLEASIAMAEFYEQGRRTRARNQGLSLSAERLSLLTGSIAVRDPTSNLEHRRVNAASRKHDSFESGARAVS